MSTINNDYSSLFDSLYGTSSSQNVSSMNFLSDWASVKNGSMAKLSKAYYAKNSEKAEKADASEIKEAMQANNKVIILYGSFKHEPREIIFSPYAIRVYKQRWYLIGESSDHPGETRVYAFDRIMQLSTTNAHFQVPKEFKVDQFFANFYGVTVGEASDVQDIIVRIQKKGVPYLRTLPLHSSQKEINTTEQYSDFQFHLAPNFEFCQELYSRANEVEILSPQSLRDKFADTFAKLNAKYNS